MSLIEAQVAKQRKTGISAVSLSHVKTKDEQEKIGSVPEVANL